MVVLFSIKVVHTPKTAARKKHRLNSLRKEKHVNGIVFALPKPNIANGKY